MSRHTAFRYRLDPTVEQRTVLARHAGAARFAYNQCLAMVKTALDQRQTDSGARVPWTRFDLINTFNTWKKSEAAGRVFTVDPDGVTEVAATGSVWRDQVCRQVFEEAATDLSRGLAGWSDSRTGKRRGRPVGFPRCECGYRADRDLNAAANLAAWPRLQKQDWKGSPDLRAGAGLPMPADGKALSGTLWVPVQPARMTREPRLVSRSGDESRTPEKGGVR